MELGPKMSFVCPMKWDDLKGGDVTRFCDSCGLQVTNLSSLRRKERKALLARAKTERVCVMYLKHRSGELVTPENPLRAPMKVAASLLAAAGVAGSSGSALSEGIYSAAQANTNLANVSDEGTIIMGDVCFQPSPPQLTSVKTVVVQSPLDKSEDHVLEMRSIDQWTFVIDSQSGIGGVRLWNPTQSWPSNLVVKINLKGLESISFDNGTICCEGSLSQTNGVPLLSSGSTNSTGEIVDLELLKAETGVVVNVPQRILADNPKSIHVKWIDFYR